MIHKHFIHIITLEIPSNGTEQVRFYWRVQSLLCVLPLTLDGKENTLSIPVNNTVLLKWAQINAFIYFRWLEWKDDIMEMYFVLCSTLI